MNLIAILILKFSQLYNMKLISLWVPGYCALTVNRTLTQRLLNDL